MAKYAGKYAQEIVEDDEMRDILTDLARRASDPHSSREWRRILKMLTKIGSPTEGLLNSLAWYLPMGSSYPVSFDYDRVVEDSMNSRRYGEQRLDVLLEKWPHMRKGIHEVNLMLFRPWKPCETKDLEVLFRERGLRSADIYELIALLGTYPQLQTQLPIVALDSAILLNHSDGEVGVPIVTGDYVPSEFSKRWRLELYRDAGIWPNEYCFAVAPKEEKP